MTSSEPIDLEQLLSDQLAQASPDLLRGLLSAFIHALMGAEADAICGAGYRQRSDERTNSRNGYRHRDFDTRAGTLDVAIPKLRQGSYFPDWLLERRKRAERALTSVVATCYLLGVSTRRMDKLVQALGYDFKGLLSIVIYTVAIALAFWNSWLAFALYVLVALMWLIPDRRIERAVAQEES